MNYVITGSLGHISEPVVEQLVEAKHNVTVITSNAERVSSIEALGAKALVGSVEDAAFINAAFAGADVVYLMIPPNFNPEGKWIDFQKKVADNYVAAVKSNNVGHVVLLSSVGAHLGTGTGPVDGASYLETKLTEANINAKFLRPGYFYYNFFSMLGMAKHAGILGSNFGGNDSKLVMSDPSDIAVAAAEELLNPTFTGQSVRYLSSDERTTTEIAAVLGKAIGKADINWVPFTDEQATEGMKQAGLADTIVNGYVEMGASLRSGKFAEDYWKNCPATQGKVKLEDFATQFAHAYNAQ